MPFDQIRHQLRVSFEPILIHDFVVANVSICRAEAASLGSDCARIFSKYKGGKVASQVLGERCGRGERFPAGGIRATGVGLYPDINAHRTFSSNKRSASIPAFSAESFPVIISVATARTGGL